MSFQDNDAHSTDAINRQSLEEDYFNFHDADEKRMTFHRSPAAKPSFEHASASFTASSMMERRATHYENPDADDQSTSDFTRSAQHSQQSSLETTNNGNGATNNNNSRHQPNPSGASAYSTPPFAVAQNQRGLYGGGDDDEPTLNNTRQSLDKNSSSNVQEEEKQPVAAPWWKRWWWVWIIVAIVILAAILIPVGLCVIKKDHNKDRPKEDTKPSTAQAAKIPDHAKGTILDPSTWMDKKDFNTTFTEEKVGGLPVMGLNSDWDDSKRPNQHVPPLNEKFDYEKRPMRGVNLGGWLIIEPFITPSFFSEKDSVVDEWTFVDHVNKTEGMGAVKDKLEKHYSTFIAESDFKEIADAGLDHVRIPYGYWAVETNPDDHFLPQVCWRYLLRAIEWARKYGLRVNIDLHSVPGGQNGWNHSGRQGRPKWLTGSQGDKYGNQTLDIHKQLAKFFAQDRYKNIVALYGLVNEPKMEDLDVDKVIEWNKRAYKLVQDQGYHGKIVFGDGFLGAQKWHDKYTQDKYPGMTLDLHNYVIFNNDLLKMPHSAKLNFVCHQWKDMMGQTSNPDTGHGPTFVGEWSQADNDCTKYVNNVGVGSRWEGKFDPGYGTPAVLDQTCPDSGNCSCAKSNQDARKYSKEYKQFLLMFAELQMDAFESNGGQGSMYWTWKTETWEAAQWSYQKGIEAGIMPKVQYERTYNCSSNIPDFVAMGLPESY